MRPRNSVGISYPRQDVWASGKQEGKSPRVSRVLWLRRIRKNEKDINIIEKPRTTDAVAKLEASVAGLSHCGVYPEARL